MIKILVMGGKLYKEVQEDKMGGCDGCCFRDLPEKNQPCPSLNCMGIIYEPLSWEDFKNKSLNIEEENSKPKKSKVPTQTRDFYRKEVKRIAKEKGLYYSTNCTINSIKEGVNLMQKVLCEKQEREYIDKLNARDRDYKTLLDKYDKLRIDKADAMKSLREIIDIKTKECKKEKKLRLTQVDEYEEILENKEDRRLEGLKAIGKLQRTKDKLESTMARCRKTNRRLTEENATFRHEIEMFRNKNFIQRMIIAFKNHI